MSYIRFEDVGIEFAGKYLFKDINCSLEHNSRIGLIGANGCGKTTLLKIMLKEMEPSAGIVSGSKSIKVAYLSQNPEFETTLTVEEYIRSSPEDLQKAWKEIIELSNLLNVEQVAEPAQTDSEKYVVPHLCGSDRSDNGVSNEENRINAGLKTDGKQTGRPLLHEENRINAGLHTSEAILAKLHKAEERFQHLGGYEFDTEMKMTLTALKFQPELWNRKLNTFSGGERTRLALAHILLSRFELLLLDEPTNHLDIAMIGWLEKYLSNQNRPYLIISHDRTFLDRTVTTIWSMENGGLNITKGNYFSWFEAQKIRLLEQERQWKQQQKWVKDTKDFIARNMAGQKTKQAQGRLKILNRTELIERPQAKHQMNLKVQSQDRSGNDVYRLENVEFGIGTKLLAKEVNLYCGYKNRICLLGQNGSGKTTLIKLMMKEIEPRKGSVKVGASLQIGYYDQYQNEMDEELTVYETLKQLVPLATDGYILGWLARFGFREDDVKKNVSVLSGGEKSRLYLSILIHEKPNLLILDEPTNHLDIMMMDALLEALKEYDGTIIFVSHDRYFIQELADKYWVFHRAMTHNVVFPTITEIDKPFEELLNIAYCEPEVEKQKTEQVNNRQKKINPWVLEQLQKEIEQQHLKLNSEQKELHSVQEKLSQTETYADANKFKKLREQMRLLENAIKETRTEIDELETKYLELIYEPK
jgi:ATP-binding cassette subfamily F protein 3